MKCDEICNELLTATESAAVQEHLAVCETCRAMSEVVELLRTDASRERQADLSAAVLETTRRRAAAALRPVAVRTIGAVAAILAFAAVLALGVGNRSDRRDGDQAVDDDRPDPLALERKIDGLRQDLHERLAAIKPPPPPARPSIPPVQRSVRRLRRKISRRSAALLDELEGLNDADTSTETETVKPVGGKQNV